MVVFFLNYTLNMSVEKTEKLQRLVKDVKDMQVNIVPVGIGENAKLSELKMMVTKDGTALHFGEYESHETLGRAVIQGNLERFNISTSLRRINFLFCVGKKKKVLNPVVTARIKKEFFRRWCNLKTLASPSTARKCAWLYHFHISLFLQASRERTSMVRTGLFGVFGSYISINR